MSEFKNIPGIKKELGADLKRIHVNSVEELRGKKAEDLYDMLRKVYEAADLEVPQEYLPNLRVALYFVQGGRDKAKLIPSAWKID